MHGAVVGGAASMGKGRPGPISTQRERKTRGPIWTQAARNVPIRMKPRREKETNTRTKTTTLQQSEKRRQKGKRNLFLLPDFALIFHTKQCESRWESMHST